MLLLRPTFHTLQRSCYNLSTVTLKPKVLVLCDMYNLLNGVQVSSSPGNSLFIV